MRPLLTLTLLLGALHLSAHDFHASLMVLDYNPKTREAEIALRLFSDDLEVALTPASGAGPNLESKQGEHAAFTYIRKLLKLKQGDQTLELTWVGMELEVDVAWVYVSCPLVAGISDLSILNSLFFDLFPDQVNTTNIRWEGKKRTLTFQYGSGFQNLD